jgi:flagellar motor switch protein FliN
MAGESEPLGAGEVEKLLEQAQAAAGPTSATPAASAANTASGESPSTPDGAAAPQRNIDSLLNQAEQALASIDSPTAGGVPPNVKPFKLVDFAAAVSGANHATLDSIRDVELDLRIELGRTHMHLEEVLKLSKGSVVTLDKLAGDPVDIFVNGRLIARGEVLILNENFCVRVAELMAPEAA